MPDLLRRKPVLLAHGCAMLVHEYCLRNEDYLIPLVVAARSLRSYRKGLVSLSQSHHMFFGNSNRAEDEEGPVVDFQEEYR